MLKMKAKSSRKKEVDEWYYVGIDQSYSSTGVVVLSVGGQQCKPITAITIKAGGPNDPFGKRLDIVVKAILECLPKTKNCLVCMEGGAFASEFNTFRLGELSGVLRYILYKEGYELELVQPTTLKKFVTGNGSATKVMMAEHVSARWGYEHPSDDVIDAYGLARVAEALNKSKRANLESDSKEVKPSKGSATGSKTKRKSKRLTSTSLLTHCKDNAELEEAEESIEIF